MNFDLNTALAVREREDGLLEKDTFNLSAARPVAEIRAARPGEIPYSPPAIKARANVELAYKEAGLPVPAGLRFEWELTSPQKQAATNVVASTVLTGGLYPVIQGIRGVADKESKGDLFDKAFKGIVYPEATARLYEKLPGTKDLPPWAKFTADIADDIISYGVASITKGALKETLLAKEIYRKLDIPATAYAKEKMKGYLPAGHLTEKQAFEGFKQEYRNAALKKFTAIEAELVASEEAIGAGQGAGPSQLQEYARKRSLLGLIIDALKHTNNKGQLQLPKIGQSIGFKNPEGEISEGIIRKVTGEIAEIELLNQPGRIIVATLSQLSLPVAPKELPLPTPTGEGKVNIKFQREGDAVGREYHETVSAIDPKTGEEMGFVKHSYSQGESSVQMVEVKPEYRKRGVGLALLNELQSQSDKPLTVMGNFATKEGQALWNKFQGQSNLSTPTGEGKVEGLKIEPIAQEAIANTQGAKITPEGIELDISRYQKEEQFGSQAIRTGVFYLPEAKSPYGKYYSTGKQGYGGGEKVTGRTTYRNPIIVKAGTGGKGVEKAYDQVEGKGAYQKMRSDVLDNAWTKDFTNRRPDENAISALLEKYGGNPDLAYEIIRVSKESNQLPYAIQEHIAAHALRKAGYDAVISHSVSGGKPRLAEVFDLRAEEYPSELSDYKYEDFYPKLSTPTGQKPPVEPPKTALGTPEEPTPIIKNLNISEEGKVKLESTIESIRPKLEEVKGKPLTHEEVKEAAKSADLLKGTISRKDSLELEARLLRTRQNLAAMAEEQGISKDFIDNLIAVRAFSSDAGRKLGSLNIGADSELYTIKSKIVNKLTELGKSIDEIEQAAKGVNFSDQKQVTEFYRKFIKPSFWELLSEYRYINVLSSPKTHIVNIVSNALQVGGLAPATKLISGIIDPVASKLFGVERQHYIKEVPAYIRGSWSAVGEASQKALDALTGKSFIERPDIKRVPTGSKILKLGRWIPQALEAADVFFRTIAHQGELEAQLVKGISLDKAESMAKKKAAYWVFRKALDPIRKTQGGKFIVPEQGILLGAIDNLTSLIYLARDLPVFGRVASWYALFVQTPMEIAKQGIEYSIGGLGTIPGSKDKVEQLSKALLGTIITAITAGIILNNDSTAEEPTGTKEKSLFRATGRIPWAIRFGDSWVSANRLGVIGYPIALALSAKHYFAQNPSAVTDNKTQKAVKVIGGMGEFFASQSYVESLGDLMDLAKNAPGAMSKLAANVPSQIIPLSSLQRWANSYFIDPVFRKAEKGLSVESIVDNAKKGIIFATKNMEAYTDPDERPSTRNMPLLNAISPVVFSKANDEYEADYQDYLEKRREDLIDKKESGNEPKITRTRRVR